MRSFLYERPTTLADAVDLVATRGAGARPLAGGTDLIIRLRDGSIRPDAIVDVKRVPELLPRIESTEGGLTFGATTTMTDVAADERVRTTYPALAEAAAVVGSVQIRNRATVAGNICNASPAADTATPWLIYGAVVLAAGPSGTRRIAIDDFFIRSGQTVLGPGELVTAIELPAPSGPCGSVHLRRTRRRGHDLAAVTMSVLADRSGTIRMAFGSVGPRPVLVTDTSGALADPSTSDEVRAAVLERLLEAAAPSPTSLRSSPAYRLAMLRVLGRRAVRIAVDRSAELGSDA